MIVRTIAAAVLLLCIVLGGCTTAFLNRVADENLRTTDDGLPGRWYADDDRSRYYLEISTWHGGEYELNLAIVPKDADPQEEERVAFATSLHCQLITLGASTFAELTVSRSNGEAIARRLGPFVLPVWHIAHMHRDGDQLTVRPLQITPAVKGLQVVSQGERAIVISPTPEIQKWLESQAADAPSFGKPITLHRSKPRARRWFGEPPHPYEADAVQATPEAGDAVRAALRQRLPDALPQGTPDADRLSDLAAELLTAHIYADRAAMNVVFARFGAEPVEGPGTGPLAEIYPPHIIARPHSSTDVLELNPGSPGIVSHFREFCAGWVRWSSGGRVYSVPALEEQLKPGALSLVVATPAIAPAGTRVVLSMQFVKPADGEWTPRAAHVTSVRTADEQPTFEHEPMF